MADELLPKNLNGRTAIVSGATGAIGRVVCLELAARGASVVALYRNNAAAAEELVRAIQALGAHGHSLRCDVMDVTSLQEAFQRSIEMFGNVSIAVHSASDRAAWRSISQLDLKEWQSYVGVGLHGAFNFLRAAISHLSGCEDRSVVLMSSIAAALFPVRNAQSAAVSSAVEALVRVCAREEGRNGVRVNAVAIGLTESPGTRDAFASWGEEASARVVRKIPLKRIGQPSDAARAVAFLVGPDSRYITGKILRVDGGQYIGF